MAGGAQSPTPWRLGFLSPPSATPTSPASPLQWIWRASCYRLPSRVAASAATTEASSSPEATVPLKADLTPLAPAPLMRVVPESLQGASGSLVGVPGRGALSPFFWMPEIPSTARCHHGCWRGLTGDDMHFDLDIKEALVLTPFRRDTAHASFSATSDCLRDSDPGRHPRSSTRMPWTGKQHPPLPRRH